MPRFLDVSHAPLIMTTEIDPRGLSPRYTQHIDPESGDVYFKNHEKKSTTWEDPRTNEPETLVRQRVREQLEAWDLRHVEAARKSSEIDGNPEFSPDLAQKRQKFMTVSPICRYVGSPSVFLRQYD